MATQGFTVKRRHSIGHTVALKSSSDMFARQARFFQDSQRLFSNSVRS
eukprot:IDg1545t1